MLRFVDTNFDLFRTFKLEIFTQFIFQHVVNVIKRDSFSVFQVQTLESQSNRRFLNFQRRRILFLLFVFSDFIVPSVRKMHAGSVLSHTVNICRKNLKLAPGF